MKERLRKYILLYRWAVRLGKIPRLPTGGGVANSAFMEYSGEKPWNMLVTKSFKRKQSLQVDIIS